MDPYNPGAWRALAAVLRTRMGDTAVLTPQPGLASKAPLRHAPFLPAHEATPTPEPPPLASLLTDLSAYYAQGSIGFLVQLARVTRRAELDIAT